MRDTGGVLAAASNKVAGGDYRTNPLFVVRRRTTSGPLELQHDVGLSSAGN